VNQVPNKIVASVATHTATTSRKSVLVTKTESTAEDEASKTTSRITSPSYAVVSRRFALIDEAVRSRSICTRSRD